MLRLSTPGQSRFVQTDVFDAVYGGGEANVAVSCANYGHDAYYVTKLPKHEIGQAAVNALVERPSKMPLALCWALRRCSWPWASWPAQQAAFCSAQNGCAVLHV